MVLRPLADGKELSDRSPLQQGLLDFGAVLALLSEPEPAEREGLVMLPAVVTESE